MCLNQPTSRPRLKARKFRIHFRWIKDYTCGESVLKSLTKSNMAKADIFDDFKVPDVPKSFRFWATISSFCLLSESRLMLL